MERSLCDIMKKYGSDKSTFHNYTKIYTELFKHLVDKDINLFELGIGTNNTSIACNMGESGKPGASLRAWKEYFPSAKIYSADIDKGILFQDIDISTFYCDQTDPILINEMWNNEFLINIEFDIMIDDGWHLFNPNLIFFQNSIHKLKVGGYYIIEDLGQPTWDSFRDILDMLEDTYSNCQFTMVKIEPKDKSCGDNNLLIVKKLN